MEDSSYSDLVLEIIRHLERSTRCLKLLNDPTSSSKTHRIPCKDLIILKNFSVKVDAITTASQMSVPVVPYGHKQKSCSISGVGKNRMFQNYDEQMNSHDKNSHTKFEVTCPNRNVKSEEREVNVKVDNIQCASHGRVDSNVSVKVEKEFSSENSNCSESSIVRVIKAVV